MILVDTSIWIEVMRKRRPLDLESVIDVDDIVTCSPIVQEVLQGIGDHGAFRLARDSMLAFPMVESPVAIEVWLEAVQIYRTARSAGITVRSSVDCLIAACALRHDLEVLHRYRDYNHLAQIVPLRVRQL